MANDIISKTGLFVAALGTALTIKVMHENQDLNVKVQELIHEKQDFDVVVKDLKQKEEYSAEEKRQLMHENQTLDEAMQELEVEYQNIVDKNSRLTTINHNYLDKLTVVKIEYQQKIGNMQEEQEAQMSKLIFQQRMEKRQLLEQYSHKIHKYLNDDVRMRLLQEQHATKIAEIEETHVMAIDQLKKEYVDALQQNNEKMRYALEFELDQTREEKAELQELHKKYMQLLHDKNGPDAADYISKMRQQHKEQVQALNTRLEQLESEIQEIGQAYETETLAEIDSEISSIKQNYETKLHSLKDTADVNEQVYTEHLLEMHNEIESLESHHHQEMHKCIESFQKQEEALKASESKLLEKTGLFAKQKTQILQGKNNQIELLHQRYIDQIAKQEIDHHAEMDDLRKDHLHEIQLLRHDISLTREDLLRHKSEFKTERNKNDTKQVQIDNHEKTIKQLETNAAVDDLVHNISKFSLK